jgi:predicted adenylyl cyclase CyaB
VPTNIEIKATVEDVEQMRRTVEALGGIPCQVLHQEDIFFHTGAGRLKIRLCSQSDPELIFYNRIDTPQPTESEYTICKVPQSELLTQILSAALGIAGVVRRRRLLFLIDKTRIHLDEVEGLGTFIELEVVLQPGDMPEDGQAISNDLMDRLDIRPEHLVACAYIDLLSQDQV